jgi:hypothetical protein
MVVGITSHQLCSWFLFLCLYSINNLFIELHQLIVEPHISFGIDPIFCMGLPNSVLGSSHPCVETPARFGSTLYLHIHANFYGWLSDYMDGRPPSGFIAVGFNQWIRNRSRSETFFAPTIDIVLLSWTASRNS